MRDMATQALDRKILVSCVSNLLTHGVSRVLQPIVALSATFNNGRTFQKENTIRGMDRMTGVTASFPDRGMRNCTLNRRDLRGSIFFFLFFEKFLL